MHRTCQQLSEDAQRIWSAGVAAVQPQRLIPQFVHIHGDTLHIGDEKFALPSLEQIVVVGAGKAGASMVAALENALGDELLRAKNVRGWVNVPADCLRTTRAVHLHAARPAGVNEPTAAGVAGTEKILQLVGDLGPADLCLCVISGGGSALLPAPIEGVSLADKVAITRELTARGATIQQLNAVRRELSTVKGGGLARACRAGHLVTLILSDVLGDDLESIASGPTVPRPPTPERAIQVLEDSRLADHPTGKKLIELLQKKMRQHSRPTDDKPSHVTNLLIGNNATAVDAAGMEAEHLGYNHAMISATEPEGPAEEVAQHLVQMAQSMRRDQKTNCLISGGEPTVHLAPTDQRGLGGRNQQLALAALCALEDWRHLALLAGGTDGEDGPTDAAGALANEQVAQAARNQSLDTAAYLRRNDAYHFFQQAGGLLKTGPTQTNVCDLRVLVVGEGGKDE